jgi:hypothetical protein
MGIFLMNNCRNVSVYLKKERCSGVLMLACSTYQLESEQVRRLIRCGIQHASEQVVDTNGTGTGT